MNTYYLVIIHRNTREIMVILKCGINHLASDVVYNYAKWNGVEYTELLYKAVICADYNDVLENKAILNALS